MILIRRGLVVSQDPKSANAIAQIAFSEHHSLVNPEED